MSAPASDKATRCRVGGILRSQAGFTLLELIVVMALVIILVVTAMENLFPLVGEAERVSVQQNRVAVDTALRGAAAERLLKQGRNAVMDLEGENPVNLLARPPGNYLGEFASPDPAEIPPGHWYWDSHNQWLVYRIRHARYFHSPLDGPARIRFQVAREGDRDFFGLHLKSLEDHHWDSDGSELARWILGAGQ